MCGIIGVVGHSNAPDFILNALKKLEYRGYDSAGLSVFNAQNTIDTTKEVGKIKELEQKYNKNYVASNCGIGHTRWATHGEVTLNNSHPHTTLKVSVVHNGIIENYLELKDELIKEGYTFKSETDTEVISVLLTKLLDNNYSLREAILKIDELLKGSYAIGVLSNEEPNTIYTLRQGSPLVIGKKNNLLALASDISAIVDHIEEYVILDDNQAAILSDDNLVIFDATTNNEISFDFKPTSDMNSKFVDKCGFDHFMLKEIHEQPEVFRRINPKVTLNVTYERIYLVGCGTAYHAGLMIKQFIEKEANIPAECHIASEFRYNPPIFNQNSLVIVISQSGETADTLAALRLAKEKDIPVGCIVNVEHSSIDREADFSLYLNAHMEVSVASTKAYFAMVVCGHYLALHLANKDSIILNKLDKQIDEVIQLERQIKEIARKLIHLSDLYYLGRGIDYINSLEASLKLKEISYIHSEAYPAGELKHGSIALIDNNSWCIGLCSDKQLVDKTISNLKEVKARQSKVLVITTLDESLFSDVADELIVLPTNFPETASYSLMVATQLLAYYVAKEKGCEIDQPRNLAKSVTVE